MKLIKPNDTFHDLTVLSITGTRGGTILCKCICGNNTTVMRAHLLSGNTKSCGCRRNRNLHSVTHGAKKNGETHPTYRSWQMMKNRCNNPNNKDKKHYIDKGIGYDQKWETYEGFMSDMGDSWKPGLSLDRKENTKSYNKENCQWVTRKEQSRNRDYVAKHTYGKKSLHSWEWAKKLGIKLSSFHVRLWKHRKDPIKFPTHTVFQKR